ncbi:MAG: ATP-binding protein [Chloroflexota bacterium]
MQTSRYELPIEKLRWRCDPTQLSFECTENLTPLKDFIGQDRAIGSLKFGLEVKRPGYNIYVAGLTGTGKTTVVREHIQRVIKEQADHEGTFQPDDWCYVYNFVDPDRPQIVRLPRGSGRKLNSQVTALLQRLREDLGKVFSSDEYRAEKKRIVDEGQARQAAIFEQVETEARSQSFVLQMTPVGPMVVPVVDGKPMSQQDYMALKEEKRRVLDEKRMSLMKLLETSFEKAREVEKNTTEAVHQLDLRVGKRSIHVLFTELLGDLRRYPDIDRYLNELETYTLDNLEVFKTAEPPAQPSPRPSTIPILGDKDPFLPFRVNVFVDNSETDGRPVITESNPTWGNLFGKVERRFLFGGYLTDHTMLKAGSLNRANGGYLLLDIKDVLTKPGVWDALKRAIRTKEVRIEDPFEQFGLIAPVGMRPAPMPMDVKVIVIGDAIIYQLLANLDEEFWELFRVKADFDFEMNRSPENMEAYACFIARCCDDEKLLHFDASGVAKILEYAARAVADQEKLSARFGQMKEVMIESDYWARKSGSRIVSTEHVRKAVDEKVFRHNLIDQKIRELIDCGTIKIDTAGAVAGQVNGLSIYSLGDLVFGRPSRITARTFLGRGGVVNIEREAQLSGPSHNKGVLILSGYLGWKYAQNKPLSLSASLCFEQSYEGVDGDSASSTELYAILSALSGVLIKQGIAVTGSINQNGEVQAIGGVNHKIEGFFRVCKAKGLTGDQGVIIPTANIRNLMLHEEVTEAVAQGKFHIYAVSNVDEGIELLTGVPAGQQRRDGKFPKDTINYLVDRRLKEMSDSLKAYQPEAPDKHAEK